MAYGDSSCPTFNNGTGGVCNDHYSDIPVGGDVCGGRAFWGRFACKGFGRPTWGATEHAHAAMSAWTPTGWVVLLGAPWPDCWSGYAPRAVQFHPHGGVNPISSGSPHVRCTPMGRTCGKPDEIKKTTHPKWFTPLFRDQGDQSKWLKHDVKCVNFIATNMKALGKGHASRAVQFHPRGGQSDFVWLSTRTPHWAYVW